WPPRTSPSSRTWCTSLGVAGEASMGPSLVDGAAVRAESRRQSMSAGRPKRHPVPARKPASEGSFSLAEFARKRDPWLIAFFQRLPSDPHRNFIQALFMATPEEDEEAHLALLRFLFAFGRPADVPKDKVAALRSEEH